ncbi:hypothetical protein HXX76_000878 [Chlamydomonas incerta]|uniref:Peptide-N-glycosidase F C-terminal domain-containing protein n=1 Tax=Chlamydomonas incerta TaxID=51695 RepID=A0A836B3K0_CHLIN|nr:hypothetical protein HXX76_000878 [Chlamydomonas incerta]|eukprot:KAG2446289.1 hypothetical protein HXX76_000878 [Chlamydomonas incerta]
MAAELHGTAGGAAGATASGAASATASGAAAAHSARPAAVIRPTGSAAASAAAGATGAVPGKEDAQAQEQVQQEQAQQEEEEPQPAIPATMVSYYDGLELMTLLQEAAARNSSGGGGGGGGGGVVEFGTTQIPGAWLVVDAEAGLAEAGWAALALMAHAGWAAWCQLRVQTTPWADGNWTVTLELRLGSGPPAATATTAAAAAAAGATATTGVTGHATATDEQAEQPKLQPGEAQQQEQKQGPGPMQSAGGASGSAGSAERDAALPRAWTASASRRRTALAGPGASQTSAAHDLRRSSSRGAAALPALIRRGKDAPLRPFSYMLLFGSAPFDSQYNTGRQPAAFPTPPGARAAALVGYLTGHGSEPEAGCAEFCPVSHTLYVNGREVAVLDWTDAGTEWGCADDVLHGGVPNQHGTWYYGRGGWCDGAAGLGPGGREPTDAGSGYIMMSTGVVWYE